MVYCITDCKFLNTKQTHAPQPQPENTRKVRTHLSKTVLFIAVVGPRKLRHEIINVPTGATSCRKMNGIGQAMRPQQAFKASKNKCDNLYYVM